MFTVEGFPGKVFKVPYAMDEEAEKAIVTHTFQELLEKQPEVEKPTSGLYQLVTIDRMEIKKSTVFQADGKVLVFGADDSSDTKKRVINFLRTGTY